MNVSPSELDLVGKVAEAFLARYRRGERPSVTEYVEKYPELAEQIRDLFPALVVLEELGSVEGPRSGFSTGMVPGKGHVPEQLGDYRILREVGRGGMGVVYEAVQESLGRHVAVKVLCVHGLSSPTQRERFRREARAAAQLHHTNIVPVHGIGEQNGIHYYAMQFIQGQGLDEVLKEVKRLRCKKDSPSAKNSACGADRSPSLAQGLLTGLFDGAGTSPSLLASSQQVTSASAASSASGTELTAQPEAQYFRSVAQMGVQVAAGLDYAHKQGILHRDIKPSNLLLDARGTVWITDFGLAKAEGSDELTHTGDIVGTLRYMAPERLHGRSDPRSDVYGLGITLYELLTLHPAFEDAHRSRLTEQITHDDPPRPRTVDRLIPRDLETIVLKAIAKEPDRRYPTAAELAEDLGRFLRGEPVRARRTGMWQRAVKWVKRRPAVAALLVVSAAAAFSFLIGILVYNAKLGRALGEAQANLEKAQLAEHEKTRQLAIAHVREAQARRNSGLVGRRFESLESLKKAGELFRGLGELDEARTLELRNEAIACLPLADLKRRSAWTPDAGWSQPLGFDPTSQYYVVRDYHPEVRGYVSQGHLSVRRVADHQETARLQGFGIAVVAVQFSPDSRYLAAHYERGQRHNYVWDLSRGEAILKVSQGSYESYPAFSPDSRLAALSRPDASIRIWELPSGTKWKDLPPSPPGHLVRFHPDGRRLIVVSSGTVQLRDLSDGKELATFQHPGGIRALAWRSDGKAFATGGDAHDHDIYVWDLANSTQPVRTLKGHFGAVANLAFSRGGDLLLSESWDSTERFWDPITGQQLFSKPWDYYKRNFGPEDRELDCRWQVATGRECRTFQGSKRLSWVAISPQGRLMASVCTEGVQLWDLAATREGDKLLDTLRVGSSCTVHFDPKGESLLTDGRRAGLQRWKITPDPETGGLRIGPPQALGLSGRAPLLWPGYDPDFALSGDGRTIAHCPQTGKLLLFDPEEPRRKLLIESNYLRHAAFSPDGRWLATGNWHGRGVTVWDTQTGKRAHDFDVGDQDEGTAWPAFSPDGKWLVTGTFAEYRFWEVGSWQTKHRLPRENSGKAIGHIVFAPDGTMVAVLHSTTEVRLVDPATGRAFAHLPAAGTPYCFSPDGSQLVSFAGRDGAFQVWDLRLIRRQLKEMDLDWDLPAYPPPPSETAKPLRIKVLAAEPPAPSAERDARAFLERGLLHVRLRQYPYALKDFSRADALQPGRPPWNEVVRAYSQALERNPQDAEAYHGRADAYARLGQWEHALDDHFQAIKRAPGRREFLVSRGRTYLHAGQIDKAAEDFRKAGALTPTEANSLAWDLVTLPAPLHRERSLAVELAKQAVQQAPGETGYWNTLGVAHYRTGAWRAAIQALEEAEKRAPGKYFSFNALFLAMCHQQLGEPIRARDYYMQAVHWCQENQAKLSAQQQHELNAFRAEAEAVLNVSGVEGMREEG